MKKILVPIILAFLITFNVFVPKVANADNDTTVNSGTAAPADINQTGSGAIKLTLDDALNMIDKGNPTLSLMDRKIEVLQKQYKDALDRSAWAKGSIAAYPDDEDIRKDALLNFNVYKYNLDNAQHDRDLKLSSLKNDVIQKFRAIKLLEDGKINYQASLLNLDKTMDGVNAKIKLGLLVESEIKQYEIQKIQLQASINSNQRDIDSALTSIKQSLGIDSSKTIEIVPVKIDFIRFDDSSIDKQISDSIANSFTLKQMQVDIDNTEIQQKIASQFIDNGESSSSVDSLETSIADKQTNMGNSKLSLESSLRTGYYSLKNLEDTISIEQLSVESCQINLQSVQANVNVGKLTELDELNSKLKLDQEQAKLQSAISDYLKAVVDYKVSLGTINSKDIK